jgi:hypothetical protein
MSEEAAWTVSPNALPTPSIILNCVMACLFVFISSTMRFSRYGLGASYLATHNHSAIPEVTHHNVKSDFKKETNFFKRLQLYFPHQLLQHSLDSILASCAV